jgi:hypothetical protein
VAAFVALVRSRPLAASACALVALDVVLRLGLGEPYPGASTLLLLACGIAMVPLLPQEISRASARIAVVPALGLVSFAVLLTTLSVLGIELTELSIRLVVAAFVGCLALVHGIATRGPPLDRRDALALAALVCISAFALGAAWEIVGPFPPPGVDWGHYLLYADEVAANGELLVEARYSGEDGRLFADSPGIGALYGGTLILDGVESSSLSVGVVVISALPLLTVFVAGASLWGLGAGIAAAGVYAVSPIHMDPIRWHGAGTILALVFLPLVVLALGLMFRGVRGLRVGALLAAGLVGVTVMHATSAFVVAFLLGVALVVDAVRHVTARPPGALHTWWNEGIVRPLALGLALAGLSGAAVLVHLRSQAANLGPPIDHRFFDSNWFSWQVVEYYYSLAFLALVAVAVVLVLSSRTLRRDAALLAVVSLGTACVLVGELSRLEIPFEYRRVVHYLGIAMSLVVGAATLRLPRSPGTALVCVVLVVYLAHHFVGLRLPHRILTEREARGTQAQRLIELRGRLQKGELPDAELLVADDCVPFVVPYVLRRPTIVAFEPWQVGFANRLPLARKARTILGGGQEGRKLAQELGVDYAVVDPRCTPGVAERLDGRVVLESDELEVVLIPSTRAAR